MPIENALPDREPAEGISHEVTDMAKIGNAANHPIDAALRTPSKDCKKIT